MASYQFSSGLKPFIGYFLSHGENIENVGGADIVKYIDIGLSYYFNKNIFAYCDYKSNLLDSNNYLDVDSDDKIGIGITYQF